MKIFKTLSKVFYLLSVALLFIAMQQSQDPRNSYTWAFLGFCVGNAFQAWLRDDVIGDD